jgi:uncharacterized membrane protein
MRISDIKYKATEILRNNKEILFKVFIFMGVGSAIFTYIRNLLLGSTIGSLVSFIILIATLTFSQGYIRTSLKAVNNQSNEIDIQKDGLTGFYRFKELFGTYFVYGFFLTIIVIVLSLIMIVAVVRGAISSSTMNELSGSFSFSVQGILNGATNGLSNHAFRELQSVFGTIFIFIVIIFTVVVVYLSNFALTFYIVEKYNITGVAAMKESVKLMKGYKKTYILLSLSYIGWLLLTGLLEGIVDMIIPIPLVVSIAGVVISTVLYNTHMNVSLAIMYEEIDLAKQVDVK